MGDGHFFIRVARDPLPFPLCYTFLVVDLSPVIWVALGLLGVWLAVLTFLYWRAIQHYRLVVKGAGVGDVRHLWEEHLSKVGELASDLKNLEQRFSRLQEGDQKHLQKVGVVRFNPFGEVGGNQSFAIAILDANQDGVIISSLHGREGTRIYGKPVKAGQEVGYAFSDEEREAVDKATAG